MKELFLENLGTIVVFITLTAVIALAVARLHRDKKSGKCSSCGCSCESCPGHCVCK